MADFIELEKIRKKVKLFQIAGYKFSDIEIRHLSIAMIMIILTIFVHNNSIQKILTYTLLEFLKIASIYALTIGTGFIFHELGHKFVAQHYKFVSEFRADFQMLGIMFIAALFLPIIMLAPGAVMVLGRPTIRQNGIISVAGPLVNLALATIFLTIKVIFNPTNTLLQILEIGIFVNAFLGIFNMLPFWILDGKKVWAWSRPVWCIVMSTLILFFIIA